MASSSPCSYPPWVELPSDITSMILLKLGPLEILSTAQRVCRTWWRVCKDPSMWRSIDMRLLFDDAPSRVKYDRTLSEVCNRAVDLSQGQLVDLSIEGCTADLLLSISERCSQLKRLRLACCYSLNGDGLTEAIKKFLLLEELHLYFFPLCTEGIHGIGSVCQNLKSFKLNNNFGFNPPMEYDLDALAIAQSMPELRHLQILGNRLTNAGLQAILDGCPHLESLDLRQCFNVFVDGDLRKLCSERIQDLRCPCEPIGDNELLATSYVTSGDMFATEDSDSDMVSESSYSNVDYSDDGYDLNDIDDDDDHDFGDAENHNIDDNEVAATNLEPSDEGYITGSSDSDMVSDSWNSHHDDSDLE